MVDGPSSVKSPENAPRKDEGQLADDQSSERWGGPTVSSFWGDTLHLLLSHSRRGRGCQDVEDPQDPNFLEGVYRPPTLRQVCMKGHRHFMLMSSETLKTVIRVQGGRLWSFSESSPEPLGLHA